MYTVTDWLGSLAYGKVNWFLGAWTNRKLLLWLSQNQFRVGGKIVFEYNNLGFYNKASITNTTVFFVISQPPSPRQVLICTMVSKLAALSPSSLSPRLTNCPFPLALQSLWPLFLATVSCVCLCVGYVCACVSVCPQLQLGLCVLTSKLGSCCAEQRSQACVCEHTSLEVIKVE